MLTFDIDWDQYFKDIRPVCPWSYTAWKKNQIKIKEWTGEWEHLNDYQAIVYIVPNINRRRLKKLCKRVNVVPKYVWLWSEPSYGDYAGPVHILIQQDREKLYEARLSIGYYDK